MSIPKHVVLKHTAPHKSSWCSGKWSIVVFLLALLQVISFTWLIHLQSKMRHHDDMLHNVDVINEALRLAMGDEGLREEDDNVADGHAFIRKFHLGSEMSAPKRLPEG